MLGLCCYIWAFSSYVEQKLLLIIACGLLLTATSLVAEHRLWVHEPQQLWLMGYRAQAQ